MTAAATTAWLNRWAGATVLVAGGGGLIASRTAQALADLAAAAEVEVRVVCLVRDLAKARLTYTTHPEIELVRQVLGEPLRYAGPADLIVHAGGASNPRDYGRDPIGVISANVRAALDLVDLARSAQTSRIVYFSSREVYGNAPAGANGRLAEASRSDFDHRQVRNAYPEAKRMTETVLAAASAEYGFEHQALRLASVYGPGMRLTDDGRLMADLISDRLAGRELVLQGDGTVVRAYCHVADAVRGVLAVLASGEPNEVYNVANETEPVTARELAELVASLPVPGTPTPSVRVLGTAGKVPAGYSTFGYLPTDTAKLEALGWRPEVGLRDGVRDTLDWFCRS